jgi:hypothetical protein
MKQNKLLLAGFIGVLTIGILAGPSASRSSAAAKKASKKKPTVTTTTTPKGKAKPVGKAPANAAAAQDSAVGRDKFCVDLLSTRATILENAFAGADGTATPTEIAAKGASLNADLMGTVSSKAHLPILKYAALKAQATYWEISDKTRAQPTALDPKALFDATLAAVLSSDLEGFDILDAYAQTRCNFTMYIYGLGNLDEGPSPDLQDFANERQTAARSLATKVFPPAPPASPTWPRPSMFSLAPA